MKSKTYKHIFLDKKLKKQKKKKKKTQLTIEIT